MCEVRRELTKMGKDNRIERRATKGGCKMEATKGGCKMEATKDG